jgi:polyisoprenoid-binding protein YceI
MPASAGDFNMGTYEIRLVALIEQVILAAACAAMASSLAMPCSAQSLAMGQPISPAAAANQTVYEIGDVYLPISRVYVLVGKTGLGHEHGVIGQLKQGRINLDAGREAGSLVFDMTTFAADTPEARKFVGLEGTTDDSTQQQVNANMRGPSVLDVARFSTASFVIKQVTRLPQPSRRGQPQYELAGDFSLHGASRPIKVIAEAEEQNGWVHLRGGFYMLQSQFGIAPFTKAFGAVGVTDQLSVWGDIWIAKQRQVSSRGTSSR